MILIEKDVIFDHNKIEIINHSNLEPLEDALL
jgi:hypothetical protein